MSHITLVGRTHTINQALKNTEFSAFRAYGKNNNHIRYFRSQDNQGSWKASIGRHACGQENFDDLFG